MNRMAKVRPSGIIGTLSGSAGPLAFRRTRGGLQLIERESPRNRETPAQRAQRDRMTRAARAWTAMSPEQVLAWRTYASTLAPSPLDPPPTAVNVFKALAMRVIAIDPDAPIPLVPPESPFGGDGVAVTVQGLATSVRFVPDRPNTDGVATELLLQRLASPHRAAYASRYRSKGYFALSGAPIEIEAYAGWYACAVRFARAATGQAGPLLALGVVRVG